MNRLVATFIENFYDTSSHSNKDEILKHEDTNSESSTPVDSKTPTTLTQDLIGFTRDEVIDELKAEISQQQEVINKLCQTLYSNKVDTSEGNK
uniref:Uncharacterized protein n=1 Tax=Acrobeloides nanus TaxID=290746 RepID=A0A914CTZ8_9BILA